MRWMSYAWLTLGLCLLPLSASGDSERPMAVSPGSATASEDLGASCPTFSWTAVADATGYELVLYKTTEAGELAVAFTVEVPGGAAAWTPAASRCPAAESHYAWAVRALGPGGGSPWSEALLFSTPGRPSDDEVKQALAVLRRYDERSADPQYSARGEAAAQELPSTEEGRARKRHPEGNEKAMQPRQRDNRALEALSADTVGAGRSPQTVTPPASFDLTLDGSLDLGGYVFKAGVPFIHNDGGVASGNTAAGLSALVSATPGAPYSFSGGRNSAFGRSALQNSTTGAYLTASGHRALFKNSTGSYNTASGATALFNNSTGSYNTAHGHLALYFNTTGSHNTAIGSSAGTNWTTGKYNIAIGAGAYGATGDSRTTRIGGLNNQTRTYIEGIRGASGTFDQAVCTSSGEQLGPCAPSSVRFKESVATMGDMAMKIGALRPVTFRFRPTEEDPEGERPLQYGLIAEEVERVFPTLVTHDEDGRPQTVRYGLLTPLLLNELQQQSRRLARQDDELASLREQMAIRDRQLADLRRRLEKLAKKKRFRAD